MSSNYPPGVTGNEPEITGEDGAEMEQLLDDIFDCGETPDKIREILVTAGVLSK